MVKAIEDIWYDIVLVLQVIHKYIISNDALKNKLECIMANEFIELGSLTEYYYFVATAIRK